MAKKNNGQAGAEDQAPVENGHNKLREERRALEAEISEIDDKLRAAISNGNLEALETLTTRKAELPKLFIAASIAETNARQEMFNAEDQANLAMMRSAEDARDKLQAKIAERRRKFEEEIAALTVQLHEVEAQVGAALATITGARNLGAANDAGFKRSLAKLAGV